MGIEQSEKAGPLDTLLLAYDEALKQGRVPPAMALPPMDSGIDLAEFRGLQGCLQKLEKAWPRSDSISLDFHTDAVALAAQLKDLPEDSLNLRSIATVEQLRQTIVASGLLSEADLEISRGELTPKGEPHTVGQLAHDIVQRRLLTPSQVSMLCTTDLRRLVLGEYVLLEQMGCGGLGTVYKALDRKRGIEVALKMLHGTDAGAAVRLKQEFRSLANLIHPNLVVLDELQSVEGCWFITMELVDGWHFDDYVRGGPLQADHRPSLVSTQTAADFLGPVAPQPAMEPLKTPEQLDRLRESLRQLTCGLLALHKAGKLHRDVKPSNVLVTVEGRVVLVDFGLAVDLKSTTCACADVSRVAGTPIYMSLEQCEGRPLHPSSDWFGVGVMLFQLLTGRLPFGGSLHEQLDQKRKGAPSWFDVEVPADRANLVVLCRELLSATPEDRPTGPDILRRLAPQHFRAGPLFHPWWSRINLGRS